MSPGDVWAELRERKVLRLGVIYVVVGWVVIEAADVILPALNVPDWGVSLVVALVLLGFPIALVLSWMFDVTPEGVRRARRRKRSGRKTRKGGDEDQRSIAVLPFVNMSDDKDNEYFSDGMTEEILNALVRVDGLHVTSRTSSFAFKDAKESDVRDIADRLGVETVLEGSVRKAGDQIRITAQLIDAANGYHLWSDTYDRRLEDVFQVQDDIAHSIVDALKVELGTGAQEHLVEPETKDVEAYTLYLKGRFLHNRARENDLKRSLDIYNQALEHDPTYARAYAGIADTWMFLADDFEPPDVAYPKAREAAEKAIEIDPRLAEAHTAVGKVLGWFEWDFDQAELALRRAVGANRRYPDAHWGLGSILPTTGQLDEAIQEMRLAVSIDPLSPVFNYWLSRFLYFARDIDEATAEAVKAIELDPSSFRPRLILGLCRLMEGRPDEALDAFQAHATKGVVSCRTFAARAHAEAGRPDEARRILDELEAGDDYVRAEFMAAAWGALGELDRAFAALDQAYADRSAGLIYLHVDPSYDSLRGDARYAALVEKIGVRG